MKKKKKEPIPLYVGPKDHAGRNGRWLPSSPVQLRYSVPTSPSSASTIFLCAPPWTTIRLHCFKSWSSLSTKSLTFPSSNAWSRSNAAISAGESGSWRLCSKIWWTLRSRFLNKHFSLWLPWEKLWRRPRICSSLVEMEVKFIWCIFLIILHVCIGLW